MVTDRMRKPRALVIDDEPDIRDLLSITLARMEIDVEVAGDYASALKLLGPERFDLVLTDMRLPDGDGLDILRAAPARGCDAPIIVLTAHGTLGSDQAAMDLGVADFLDKSRIDATILERSIRYALSRRRQAQRLSQLAQRDG